MKTNKQSPGRPSFSIDPNHLHYLRTSKRLTQEAIAREVYAKLGKSEHTSLAAQKNNYQRWEKTGKISKPMAEALADVLGVTLAALQEASLEAQPSRIDEIQARIQAQLATGNEDLAQFFHQRDYDPASKIWYAAKDLTVDLEYAQLSQDAKALQRLSKLLGYSISELLQPFGVHGHWMLICNEHDTQSDPTIFLGTDELLYQVEKYAQECLDFSESDARVSMTQDAVWFRIRFSHPHIPGLAKDLSFVRCQVSAKGIFWAKPTSSDKRRIQSLSRRLDQYTNYICDFDQTEWGAINLVNLKLAIYQLPTHKEVMDAHGENVAHKLVALTNGCLDECLDQLPSFLRAGFGHDTATNWLCADFMDVMEPLLQHWPLQYWKFQAWDGGIRVIPEPPLRLALERGDLDDSHRPKFDIELVEEDPDGSLRPVLWRRKSIEKTLKTILRNLQSAVAKQSSGSAASSSLT